MVMSTLTILIFGIMGFLLARTIKSPDSIGLKLTLVILLIIMANSRGLGFSGVSEFHMYHHDMLQGFIGGFLIQRITYKKGASA